MLCKKTFCKNLSLFVKFLTGGVEVAEKNEDKEMDKESTEGKEVDKDYEKWWLSQVQGSKSP